MLSIQGETVGYNQAYSAYKEASVKTASQGKLIIMLYDECCRQLSSALEKFGDDDKIAAKDIEPFSHNVIKAQEIITELMVSLDMDSGGEIAQNLLNLYMFFNQELLEANMGTKPEKITFVRNMMSQLRESWASAIVNTVPVENQTMQHTGINISG